MSTDEENIYLSLSDDPEEAFAELHLILMKEIEASWEDHQNGNTYLERKYVDKIVTFDEVYNLGYFSDWDIPEGTDKSFFEFFDKIHRHVEIISQKTKMEAARRIKSGAVEIVVLDAPNRTAIHKLVAAIREKLEIISLPEPKRESLFNKLNAFSAELDRNRTRIEAFLGFSIEVSRAAKNINTELKPLEKTIDRVNDILDKAQKLRDSFPPWRENKKLAAPTERLPQPYGSNEDEIPF